jgi:hypothetical protein
MATGLERVNQRLAVLEDESKDEVATLVEILANITFFGGIKKTNCKFAKDGQCLFFTLMKPSKKQIPIASECRIGECTEPRYHYHLELSNMTCGFCQIIDGTKYTSKFRKSESSE